MRPLWCCGIPQVAQACCEPVASHRQWRTDGVPMVYVSCTDGVRMLYGWCTHGVRSQLIACCWPATREGAKGKRTASGGGGWLRGVEEDEFLGVGDGA